jgi:ribose/xylose/arabinose/galactoside ABC-type transport system permease subunit
MRSEATSEKVTRGEQPQAGILTLPMRVLGTLFSRFGIVVAWIVLSALIAIRSPVFLTATNLMNVLLQASINAIVAVGMTFVITAGGIDLSVGSIVGLAGMLVARMLVKGMGMPAAMAGSLALGLFCGCLNGFLIARFKLPPFVVTLGSMSILRGLALIYNQGRPIYGLKAKDVLQVAGYVGAVPKPVIIAAIAAGVAYFIYNHTRIGEYTIAIGGNEEAARLSGINLAKYKVLIYGFCGLMCGLAGAVLTARLYAAEPIAGSGYELDAIAATVMGGTSLSGGEGTIIGTIVGALLMSVLRNGLNLLNVQSYYQQLVIGVVIVLAVIIDRLRKE